MTDYNCAERDCHRLVDSPSKLFCQYHAYFNDPSLDDIDDNGPGTPIARLGYLLDELAKRFPGVCNPNMSYSYEPRYLEAIDKLKLELEETKKQLADQTMTIYGATND